MVRASTAAGKNGTKRKGGNSEFGHDRILKLCSEFGHARILQVPLDDINPSFQNDVLYRPVDPADPEIRRLADDIEKHGLLEPLAITKHSRFIVSGHRRYAACKLLRLKTVPCRYINIQPTDPIYDKFLVAFNLQRTKSLDEKMREVMVAGCDDAPHQELLDYRYEKSRVKVTTMELGDPKRRAKISDAKAPLLAAIKLVLQDLREFWPLTDRTVHYQLLRGCARSNQAAYRNRSEWLRRAGRSRRSMR